MLNINVDKTVEELLKKYFLSSEALTKETIKDILLERKRKYKLELYQILRKYGATNSIHFEELIKSGEVPEHPAWEELIEVENIQLELKEIEEDLGKLL